MASFEVPDIVKRDVLLHLIPRTNENENMETVLNIVKPKIKPNLTFQEEKELISCIRSWRSGVRAKHEAGGRRAPLKFVEQQAAWLSSPVTLPARFKYVKLDPSAENFDGGVKFRKPSSYCVMCSGAIAGDWPLLITKRLAKSICHALNLTSTENLQFDTSLFDCCVCSACYEKVIEVNDLVKELEQIQVKIQRLAVEFDKIFADGMKKHRSLLMDVHGVEEGYLTPIELRKEIMDARAKDCLVDGRATQIEKSMKTPFSMTTRRSKSCNRKGPATPLEVSPKNSNSIPAEVDFTGIFCKSTDGNAEQVNSKQDSKTQLKRAKPEGVNGAIKKPKSQRPQAKNSALAPLIKNEPTRFSKDGSLAVQKYLDSNTCGKAPQAETSTSYQPATPESLKRSTEPAVEIKSESEFVFGFDCMNSSVRENNNSASVSFKYERPENIETLITEFDEAPMTPEVLGYYSDDTEQSPKSLTQLQAKSGALSEYKTDAQPADINIDSSFDKKTQKRKGETKSFEQMRSRLKKRLKRKRTLQVVKPKSKTNKEGLKKKQKGIASLLKPFKCNIELCNYRCDKLDQLAGHVNLVHIKDPVPYKCSFPNCGKQTTTYKYLKVHRRRIHGIGFAAVLYSCDFCGKRYQTTQTLDAHKDYAHNSHGGSISCDICGKPCPSRRTLNIHTKTHQAPRPLKMLSCPSTTGCQRTFSRTDLLRFHKGTCHAEEFPDCCASKPAKAFCDECGRMYATKSVLGRHKRIHHAEGYVKKTKKNRIIRCRKCEFKTRDSTEMKDHRKCHPRSSTADDALQYKCNFPNCFRQFLKEGTLRTHERRHDPNFITLKCSNCYKDGFFTNASLKLHEEICRGKQTMEYVCEQCNYAFATNKYLLHHRKYRPNCKPYEPGPGAVYCPECNKCCSSNNSLNRHLQVIHNSDLKPFQCNGCERSFAIKMYLTRHLRESKYCPASSAYN